MRHRAALGLSEVTDALDRERGNGTISLAHEGELRRALHPNDCREIMHELMNAGPFWLFRLPGLPLRSKPQDESNRLHGAKFCLGLEQENAFPQVRHIEMKSF